MLTNMTPNQPQGPKAGTVLKRLTVLLGQTVEWSLEILFETIEKVINGDVKVFYSPSYVLLGLGLSMRETVN